LGRDGFNGVDRPLFTLPKSGQWTLDARGQLADPVTVHVHGMLEQIESAPKADGWTRANAGGLASNVRCVGAATAFLFHAVQPDVSSERAAVVQSLELMGAKVLHQVGLGWVRTSVYGERVADGLAYDVAMP
jgi:hypothetical protein